MPGGLNILDPPRAGVLLEEAVAGLGRHIFPSTHFAYTRDKAAEEGAEGVVGVSIKR